MLENVCMRYDKTLLIYVVFSFFFLFCMNLFKGEFVFCLNEIKLYNCNFFFCSYIYVKIG